MLNVMILFCFCSQDFTEAVISKSNGTKVYWHHDIRDVPSGMCFSLTFCLKDVTPYREFSLYHLMCNFDMERWL